MPTIIPTPLVTIVIFLSVWLIVWLPVGIFLAVKLNYSFHQPLKTEQKIAFLASLYLIAPLIIWGAIRVEEINWASCGINSPVNLLAWFMMGLLLAIIGLVTLLTIESSLNWVEWQRENIPQTRKLILPLLGLSLMVGLVEELIFRGWMLTELTSNYSYYISGAISSLIFACLHLVWERQNTLPQLPGLWLMGMVLVTARLTANGNLGLAWGLHTGWVWVLAITTSAELMIYTDKGSPWLKGFRNEPLAGLVGILLLLGTGVVCSGIRGI